MFFEAVRGTFGSDSLTYCVSVHTLPKALPNPFPYTCGLRVIQTEFRARGSRSEGVYGKDMISVQATACTENQ